MTRPPKNKYALIFYIVSGTTEVIETSNLIGAKKSKGDFTSVFWRDFTTNKTEKLRVKIVKVNSKY